MGILKKIVRTIVPDPQMRLHQFDEQWYLTRYPDIALAVKDGRIPSGRHHYLWHGFDEGRLGSPSMAYAAADSGEIPDHWPGLPAVSVGRQATAMARFLLASLRQRLARVPRHWIDELMITRSGAIFLMGWIEDADALESVALEGASEQLTFGRDQLIRTSHLGIEFRLGSPPGQQRNGFLIFSASGGPTTRAQARTVLMRSADEALATARVRAQLVTDVALRNMMLAFHANRRTRENTRHAAIRELDAGFGRELIALNRRVLRDNRNVTISRFNPERGPINKSFVTCLYGSPEFLPLQLALFSDCPGFESIEFIYINNSPELGQHLEREAKQAARLYGVPLTLIHSATNLGFAAANNLAAEHARADRLIFVNPDVLPKDLDWLSKHDEFAQTNAGKFFGARLYYDDGSAMHAGMYFDSDRLVEAGAASELLRVEHYAKGFPDWVELVNRTRVVPAVTGAFMSIERSHFEMIGGFDEDYIFGHYEDADLCLKSAAAGQPVWYCAEVQLWHMEGKGSPRHAMHDGAANVNRWLFTRKWSAAVQAERERARHAEVQSSR